MGGSMKANMTTLLGRAGLAFATVLMAVVLAAPQVSWGQDQNAASPRKGKAKHSAEWVDTRISELHGQLMITPAQEPVWENLAQVMRDNAKKMKDLYERWNQNAGAMNALESLKMQTEMSEEHLQSHRRFLAPFEALYNTMSDEQKKIADSVFTRHKERKQRKGK